MSNELEQKREAYEEFLVEVDMLLEDLQSLLDRSNRDRGVRVAFDDVSLQRIEQFYLDVLAGKEKPAVSQARLDRIMLAYYGEAFRERVGGRWDFNETRGDPALGTPLIVDWRKDGGEAQSISPVERREMQKQDRKPFLLQLVQYGENVEQLERDLFKDL